MSTAPSNGTFIHNTGLSGPGGQFEPQTRQEATYRSTIVSSRTQEGRASFDTACPAELLELHARYQAHRIAARR